MIVEDTPQRLVLVTSGKDRVVGVLLFIAGAFVMLSGLDLWLELNLGIAITEDMSPVIGIFMGSLFALFGIGLMTKEEHMEVDFVGQQVMGRYRHDAEGNPQPIPFSEISELVIETQKHAGKGGPSYTYHLYANEVKDDNTIIADYDSGLVDLVARKLTAVTKAGVRRIGTDTE